MRMQAERFPHFCPPRGNTLAEFGLTMALLLVAGFTVFFLLGDNIHQALNGLMGNMALHRNHANNVKIRTEYPFGQIPGTRLLEGSRMRIGTDQGREIELIGFPSNLTGTIQSIGANGATDMLADLLMQLSRQLLEAGEIDAGQASLLAELANQGHRMGAMEKVIEKALLGFDGDINQMHNTPVQFDGRTFGNVQSLADLIGRPDMNSEAEKEVELIP